LEASSRRGDVILIIMGAGDITDLGRKVMERFSEK